MGQKTPDYEKGYADGFADGVNDAAPDLVAAARAVLVANTPAARMRLRDALRAAERKT